VITQGILGGITVLWFLPDPISIAHASLAQIVFCLTATIALATSPGWRRAYASRTGGDAGNGTGNDALLQRIAIVTTGLVYLQILVGATMRHTEAGLAIPDFPWAFGHVIPPHWTPKIAIHFAHRVGALLVATMTVATAGHVFYHHPRRRALVQPAVTLMGLVCVQVTLGALTVLSQKHYIINSLHVVTGGLVLVTSLVLTLRAHRTRFGSESPAAIRFEGSTIAAGPGGTAAGARI